MGGSDPEAVLPAPSANVVAGLNFGVPTCEELYDPTVNVPAPVGAVRVTRICEEVGCDSVEPLKVTFALLLSR